MAIHPRVRPVQPHSCCARALEPVAGRLSGVGCRDPQGLNEDGGHNPLKPGGRSVLPRGLWEGEELPPGEPLRSRLRSCGLGGRMAEASVYSSSTRLRLPVPASPGPCSLPCLASQHFGSGPVAPTLGRKPILSEILPGRVSPWRQDEGGPYRVRQALSGRPRVKEGGGCDLGHLGFGASLAVSVLGGPG